MRKSVYSRECEVLAEVLSAARKEAGLHQADLAARMERDQSVVSNIERGQRRVDVIEFYEIAKVLECDPTKLFSNLVQRWDDIKKVT